MKAFIFIIALPILVLADSAFLNTYLDSIKLLDAVYFKRVSSYDTIRSDSTFGCTSDTCTITFQTTIDTNYTTDSVRYTWQCQFSFDFYNSANALHNVSLSGEARNHSIGAPVVMVPLSIDSTWGDLLIRPGTGFIVHAIVSATQFYTVSIELKARQVGGVDTCVAHVGAGFPSFLTSTIINPIKIREQPSHSQSNSVRIGTYDLLGRHAVWKQGRLRSSLDNYRVVRCKTMNTEEMKK